MKRAQLCGHEGRDEHVRCQPTGNAHLVSLGNKLPMHSAGFAPDVVCYRLGFGVRLSRRQNKPGVETFEVDAKDLQDDRARVSLVMYHRDGSELVALEDGRAVVIGRESPADVAIGDRSLSREHARFSRDGLTVTVEDLGSTNGTFVNEARIERATVTPKDRIRLGLLTASLHVDQRMAAAAPGLAPYDEFLRQLGTDVDRARALERRGGLIMIRGASGPQGRIGVWHAQVAAQVRPIDRIAAYGPSDGLIWLEDTDASSVEAIANKIVTETDAELFVGVAQFPWSATTADELLDVCRHACREADEHRRVVVAGRSSAEAAPNEERLVRSPAMIRLYKTVERVARSTIPVLVFGETGTGKEVLARAVHEASPRRNGPLRSINCGAIPAQLIESELFGHIKGAFTGAETAKRGLFEEADGGSLLLDEVGELSMAAQVALLRVLEERRVRRVGSAEERSVDVRIIAATHRDLEKMVEEGSFREDLFYRLNVMTLEIPPLRERREEILPLAETFLRTANADCGASVRGVSPEAAGAMEAYRWPGNVRELRNAVDRAVVVAEGDLIALEDLPKRVTGSRTTKPATSPEPPAEEESAPTDLRGRVKAYERKLLSDALEKCDWNLTKAAEMLDLPYRTLTSKMKALGLQRPTR